MERLRDQHLTAGLRIPSQKATIRTTFFPTSVDGLCGIMTMPV